jgi:hypothetical protein
MKSQRFLHDSFWEINTPKRSNYSYSPNISVNSVRDGFYSNGNLNELLRNPDTRDLALNEILLNIEKADVNKTVSSRSSFGHPFLFIIVT